MGVPVKDPFQKGGNTMANFSETEISRAIIETYHQDLSAHLESDVLVVGAGPSGLIAAWFLATHGAKVTVLEKRLAPGGGVWGGGMAMNVAVIQEEARPILEEIGVRTQPRANDLYVVHAMELASALCLKAIQAGAAVLNLTLAEDVCVRQRRVTGIVANRTGVGGVVPVDPLAFAAKAVLDTTGHEAVVVECLRWRGMLADSPEAAQRIEGPMDAAAGEAFVVENVAEVFPGLWVAGMSVCATFGGPRMGPIFGGMLLSGWRAAERIASALSGS